MMSSNRKTPWLLILSIFLYAPIVRADFPFINVTSPQQFATVLVSENYHPTQPPSQFFGMMFVSVSPEGLLYALSVTVWHQVQFATEITLKNYDAANDYTLTFYVAQGSAASSNNCPINVVILVDKKVLNLLNNGDIYVQISSGGQAGGQLQGNLYRRNDLLVAFVNIYNGTLPDATQYLATQGMAIIQIYTLPQQGSSPDSWLGFDYYLLSTGLPDGYNFQALQVGQNNIVAYLGNNSAGSVPVTGTWDTGRALQRMYAIVDSILYGPGSTEMYLTMLVENSTIIFTPFVRLYRPSAFTAAELEFVGSSDGEEGPLHPKKFNNKIDRNYYGAISGIAVGMLILAAVSGVMIAWYSGAFGNAEKK
jgi:hypothetical protein